MIKRLLPVLTFSLMMIGCAAGPNQSNKNQALIKASRTGDMGRVATLISQGADINATDGEGWTPYLAASAEGNWKVMKFLQEMGAKTDPGF